MLIEQILPQLLDGHIDVHLKNGLKFSGVLKRFDQHMNVLLHNPKDLSGNDYKHFQGLTSLFVKGTQINYISYDDIKATKQ